MNGKITGIIVCGVTAVCLVGTMALLKYTDNGENSDSSSVTSSESSQENESISILSSQESDIKAIKVTNTYGGFNFTKSSTKGTWNIDELSKVNQDSSMTDSLLSNTANMEAKKLVEEDVTDFEKYGLDKPQASVKISYADGKDITLDIGTKAPENNCSYVKINGEKKVYMVLNTKLNYYTEPVTEYVSKTLIAQPDDDSWPEYGKETISRKDLDYDIVFENDPKNIEGMISEQVMTEPIFSYLNISNSSSATHGMWGLTASGCEKILPTEEDFKKYGLDDPLCTVKLKGDGYNYLLKIGNPVYAESDSDSSDSQSDSSQASSNTITGYYCYLTGVSGADCIFIIAPDSLPWVTMKPSDVITGLMTTNYIVDTAELKIQCPDKTYDYKIESNGSSDESETDSGEKVDVTKVTENGKELDIDNFKSLYQYVISCPTSEIYFKEPEGEKYMTITIKREDGDSDILEFYKDSSRRYIIKLNGKTSFRIQSTWVDTLLKNADKLQKGEIVDDTY